MPSVGYHHLGVNLASHTGSKLVSPFLQGNAQQCCGESYEPWLTEMVALNGMVDVVKAVIANHHSYGKKSHADERRGERLVLAVTIVVTLVNRLRTDAHKDHHDDVGKEI